MVGSTQLFGGFSLSPNLARRVFDAVREITTQSTDLTLSHVDDDDCAVCRAVREKETRHDAPQPDRPGREWAA